MTLPPKKLKLAQALKSVSEGHAKSKPTAGEFSRFKTEIAKLLEKIKCGEREEKQKNDLSDFLKNAYYKDRYYINISENIDLAIYNGPKDDSRIGVIIETKTQDNKAEMITTDNLNKKSLHQLVLYYFREKSSGNDEITHLIATNVKEWFIFDAKEFKNCFYENKKLVAYFNKYVAQKVDDHSTNAFYTHIERFIADNEITLDFTHFKLDDYKDTEDESALIELYKILSPEHLLKLPFKNDSNTLNKKFYNELLYILGLTETGKQKKTIERCPVNFRKEGALLEEIIAQLEDQTGGLPNPSQYGSTEEDRHFNIALELAITWINRILFLKLLESQLIDYHGGDKAYSFLASDKIKSYHDLRELFFDVLAKETNNRSPKVKEKFVKVPYLNSTLFTRTELELRTIQISNLKGESLPFFSQTVLTEEKKQAKPIGSLEYLLKFLDAYDFGSMRDDKFQSRELINASVLGLIFEKINGYKDGSHFTPGFITEYMCRESIRKAVVKKFNEVKKWKCKEFKELYNKIKDINEANKIVNSLKICDPAVGSGHFLVSALNEIIAIKHELRILCDREGDRLKEYEIKVVDDELQITEKGKPFAYHPKDKESQRVQETLFHEKQTIIENCLFGVDINPNSVAICRLRLWIELLKNAYYKNDTELETLPNIDINIKCGNSLESRFPLKDKEKKKGIAPEDKNSKKINVSIKEYRKAVSNYHNAKSKEQKREIEKLIAEIKSNFRVSLQRLLFEDEEEQKATARKVYEHALEWRFEFPEVLDEKGDFIGFDVIFANPPYSSKNSIANKQYRDFFDWVEYKCDPFAFFIQLAWNSVSKSGIVAFIIPVTWMTNVYYEKLRRRLIDTNSLSGVVLIKGLAFHSANVDTSLLFIERENVHSRQFFWADTDSRLSSIQGTVRSYDSVSRESRYDITPEVNTAWDAVRIKIEQNTRKLGDFAKISLGMKLDGNDRFVTETQSESHPDPIIFGKDIALFGRITPTRFFNFSEAKIIGGTKKPAIHRTKNKIVIQAIRNLSLNRRIVATLDDQGMCFVGTVNSVIPQEAGWDIYYLLGLINSRLLNSYFGHRFTTISLTAAFLGELPIIPPDYDVKKSQKISKLVRQRLSKKTNRTALESEIDRLVYELYGLTEEEIRIVEWAKHDAHAQYP